MNINNSYILPKLGLLAFLIVGFFAFSDYGIGWDEEYQINENGNIVWNFLKSLNPEEYIQSKEKYHGPAFEIVLTFFKKVLSIDDPRNVFFMRHLLSYIFFWLSGIALFKILKIKYKDSFLIFSGICLYFLTPRIFADSFYNTKDVPFMAMNMICLFSMINYLEKPGLKSGLFHGLCCGFMIAIRIMGVMIPILTLCVILSRILFYNRSAINFHALKTFPVYIFFTVAFTILFWPILWMGPITHFVNAWNEMSRFTWDNWLLYRGEYLSSLNLPWHYNFVWIGITTPIQYLLLFLTALIICIYNLCVFTKSRILNLELEFICIALFFVPLLSIVFLKSVVYDGWRHVFFLYVPICLLAIRGLYEVRNFLIGKMNIILINLITISIFLPVAITMAKMHPYQNIYFNRIVGPDANSARLKYELDYWGLAYREALEKLYIQSNDSLIIVNVSNPPGIMSAQILPKEMRNRFKFVVYDSAHYFISDYRWARGEFEWLKGIDSIKVDGAVISATFDQKFHKK